MSMETKELVGHVLHLVLHLPSVDDAVAIVAASLVISSSIVMLGHSEHRDKIISKPVL
jgi:hypothetical protein